MFRNMILATFLIITTVSAATHPQIDLWFIYRNGCPACAQMETKLRQPNIAAILKRSYRVHRVERSEQDILPRLSMHTHTFPTLIISRSKKQKNHQTDP